MTILQAESMYGRYKFEIWQRFLLVLGFHILNNFDYLRQIGVKALRYICHVVALLSVLTPLKLSNCFSSFFARQIWWS